MNIHTTVWGLGNPLLKDDGAGLEVIRLLQEASPKGFSLRSCELAPGNYLGTLAREQPQTFILVDASDMGLPPGCTATVIAIQPESTDFFIGLSEPAANAAKQVAALIAAGSTDSIELLEDA